MDGIFPTLETELQGFSLTIEALSTTNRVRLMLCEDSSRRKGHSDESTPECIKYRFLEAT